MILSVGTPVIAQSDNAPDIDKIPLNKLLKFAEKSLEKGDVYTAIDYYEKYVDTKYMDYDALYKLARLCMRARDYEKAEKYFAQTYEGSPDVHVKALFYQADMLKRQAKYPEAKELFEKFTKEYRRIDFRRWALNQAEGCEMAIKMRAEPLNLDLNRMDASINSAYIEFSPFLMDQETLIYGSLPADTMPYFRTGVDEVTIPFRKLYKAERVNDLEWKGGDTLEGPFNKPGMHSGNVCLTPNGKRIYFTRCKVDWQNKSICHIYVSDKEKGEWQEAEKLPYPVNVENASSTMPTVGYKKKMRNVVEVLYFASNREHFRSEGGYDIWYSEFDLRDSVFDDVRNCGRKINSPGDELSPYYDNNSKTLYYSTEYEPGLGGLDVFSIRGKERRWKKPQNLGYPINSEADDLYFMLNPSQKAEGFFTSNRKGGSALFNETCCDDIYTFYNKDYINLAVTGTVYDVSVEKQELDDPDYDYLQSANVTLYMMVEDEEEPDDDANMMEITSDTTDENGNYLLSLDRNEDYRLMFSKDGYFYKQIDLSTYNRTRSDTFDFDQVYLEEISNKPIVFYIYYDFDQSDLTEEAKNIIDTTLYKVLRETPDIIVEISSHTDSQGDSAYNQKLSQERADKVVDYLIDKGIEQKRLVAKGYGETQPIATNDTEEGRAKNRRTEFEVIGSIDPYSKLNVSNMKIISKEEQEKRKKKEAEEEKKQNE